MSNLTFNFYLGSLYYQHLLPHPENGLNEACRNYNSIFQSKSELITRNELIKLQPMGY